LARPEAFSARSACTLSRARSAISTDRDPAGRAEGAREADVRSRGLGASKRSRSLAEGGRGKSQARRRQKTSEEAKKNKRSNDDDDDKLQREQEQSSECLG